MHNPQPHQEDSPDDIEDLDEISEVIPSTFTISSYGADYPVDALVKRMGDEGSTNNDIFVPRFNMEPEDGQSTTGFQRDFVWSKAQADRFIESLLLGLPVPGIFFVKEANGKLLVLDGQQRLLTLKNFYNGIFRKEEFRLGSVQERWQGKTYKTLDADDRRRLDNSIIHATIVRQDEPDEDQSSVYLIFERLNSGGTILQPQEIRVALYHGELAALLSKLNQNTAWRSLYGKKSARLKDIELILRFFAFYYYMDSYKRPMKSFLNRYMATNKNLMKQSEDELTSVFLPLVDLIFLHLGSKAFRPSRAVNAAVADSIMVGIAKRLQRGPIMDHGQLISAYNELLQDPIYNDSIIRSTANEDSVKYRLDAAIKKFQIVP